MKLVMQEQKKFQFTLELNYLLTLFRKNIIITGSHGKTYDLVAKILSDQKLDPTIINGGVINSLKSNAKLGKENGRF